MAAEADEAEDWERGSRSDPVRNRFVVPHLVRVLGTPGLATILDVGAGTGYVARQVHSSSCLRPRWTLLDPNQHRLSVAARERPEDMDQELIPADIMSLAKGGRAFHATLMLFTLLEIADVAACARALRSLTVDGGKLVVVLPDVWVDVLSVKAGALATARQFLRAPVDIEKTDKFTGNRYPFHAVRLESVIREFLASEFRLRELEFSDFESGGVFLAVFEAVT